MDRQRKLAITTALLVASLLVANGLALLLYRTAFPLDAPAASAWAYLGSDVFKVVTATIVLPFLLAIVDQQFKIGDAVEERVEQRRQARRDSRWECVKRTSQMWSELFTLTTRVRYYEDGKRKDETIEGILQDLRNFSTVAEDVVNEWSHSFPNLSLEDLERSLVLINAQLSAAETVASAIERGAPEAEVRALQSSLDVIQGTLKTMLHHNLLNALKASAQLEEEDGLSPEDKRKAEEKVKTSLSNIRVWAERVHAWERRQPYLPGAGGAGTQAFEAAAKALEQWARENPEEQLDQWERYGEFQAEMDKLPDDAVVSGMVVPYSKEYVHVLARNLAQEGLVFAVWDRAHA